MPGTEPPAGHEPEQHRTPHQYQYRYRPSPRRSVLVVLLAAYALYAAGTTPFTRSANVATALPIVAVVALAVACWPLRARPRTLGPDAGHPWQAWVCILGAVVAWELAGYAARGSRGDHPTLSSMLDAVNRFYGLKAVVFFLWLSLGAAIVWRGGSLQGRARSETP